MKLQYCTTFRSLLTSYNTSETMSVFLLIIMDNTAVALPKAQSCGTGLVNKMLK